MANRLKFVFPKLIGREKAGFMAGRSPFDNIIALQEIAHTIEKDFTHPPRMIVKIDIEKAYDSISWAAILTTLTKMNFPPIWVSWIKTCLSATPFSLLINESVDFVPIGSTPNFPNQLKSFSLTHLFFPFQHTIPLLTLSLFPDTVLKEIDKIVRDFLWYKGGNGKGIHDVAWANLTLPKPEGGLGIRNLFLATISLMANNVFKFLNDCDAIWVNILVSKYGKFNFWKDSIPSGYSWFFRGLCYTANRLKPYCSLNSVNPNLVSFLYDPWCDNIPLAFNPTFL
ncbi:uncharacterized protein LOC120277636 [Dioscorea cayenensis subsp. rotundata]|uniref:Uncharacterized protein LOC120277636 n=1 Tax=Dioscorea cayennensis subsp. rotundata TaxID=55577 RepID=A0AB40CPD0_DIOCR|nr:uncharacterized protein LOC120277636 [Dioscorea cayenensis subsp. rotundata]